MLNPLRSEQEAFRFLLYVAVIVGVLTAAVLLVRAIS
jgi:Flp pilus assembly protein protease CpaA